ncbi:hypothetical protein AGLY_013237 [Aphis glycines]|uniref:Uncharacterized protein n=1 Tax=Aphis glycines TaxID=307491 RepID=A0A6G0T7V3_APHGL|nr:hypothetical protein AGLY_013237 [Aphis glycines]
MFETYILPLFNSSLNVAANFLPTVRLMELCNVFLIFLGVLAIEKSSRKQYVVKRDVGHRSVHWEHEAGIIQLRADFGQTEHRESPIVTFILEMVGVPPHQWESRQEVVSYPHAFSSRIPFFVPIRSPVRSLAFTRETLTNLKVSNVMSNNIPAFNVSDHSEHPVRIGWSGNKKDIRLQEVKEPTHQYPVSSRHVSTITSVGSLEDVKPFAQRRKNHLSCNAIIVTITYLPYYIQYRLLRWCHYIVSGHRVAPLTQTIGSKLVLKDSGHESLLLR